MRVWGVCTILEKNLPNVSYSRGGRPRLLNKKMERSCVLQMTRQRTNIVPHVQNMTLGY